MRLKSLIGAVSSLVLVACGGLDTSGDPGAEPELDVTIDAAGPGPDFTWDVSINCLSFVVQGPTAPSGFPDYGASFIVQGVLYDNGFFAANGNTAGLNADGTPSHPGSVRGRWQCRGWVTQDLAAPTGDNVNTNQLFERSPIGGLGKQFVTEGLERAEFNLDFFRSITGGTDEYSDPDKSKHTETNVDLNATGCPNATYR